MYQDLPCIQQFGIIINTQNLGIDLGLEWEKNYLKKN